MIWEQFSSSFILNFSSRLHIDITRMNNSDGEFFLHCSVLVITRKCRVRLAKPTCQGSTGGWRLYVHPVRIWILLACEQALCLGKKITRKGKGRGERAFSLFPLPSSPLDQRPVHRLGFYEIHRHWPNTVNMMSKLRRFGFLSMKLNWLRLC